MANVIDSVMQKNRDKSRTHCLIYRFKTGMVIYDRKSDKMGFRRPLRRRIDAVVFHRSFVCFDLRYLS